MRSAKSLQVEADTCVEAPEAAPEARAGLKLQRDEFSRHVRPIVISYGVYSGRTGALFEVWGRVGSVLAGFFLAAQRHGAKAASGTTSCAKM